MTTTSGTVTYTYDVANRLTSVGGVSYTCDDNGNLTSDGTYTYTCPLTGISAVLREQCWQADRGREHHDDGRLYLSLGKLGISAAPCGDGTSAVLRRSDKATGCG